MARPEGELLFDGDTFSSFARALHHLRSSRQARRPRSTGRPAAIPVSPIHEAQTVRGDDGMDHVEYELLVVVAFLSR